MPKEEKGNPILFGTLAACNLASGSTTILGAIQIFPAAFVGIVAGGFIQLLLFLLTSGKAVRDVPLIKWPSALFLSALSVYTSFFAYYNQLTIEQKQELLENMAVAAHYGLVEQILPDMERQLREKEFQYEEKVQQALREAEKGIISGETGYGEEARKLELESLELKAEYDEFNAMVTQVRSAFNYDPSGLENKVIHQKDRSALAVVPPDFRPDGLDNQNDLPRSNYVDEDKDISFLEPYYKIQEADEPAIVSMGLAVGLDGVILGLGFALASRRKKKGLIRKLTDQITTTIRGVKVARKEISHTWAQPADVYPTSNEKEKLDEALEIARNSGISVVDLLGHLLQVVDEDTRIIHLPFNNANNIPTEGPQRKQAMRLIQVYKVLLNTMYSPLGWLIRHQSGNWCIREECYKRFVNWVRDEMQRASQGVSNQLDEYPHVGKFFS